MVRYPHIDRGLLVKEWCKGNRVSAIQRTESGANAGGGNKTDRNPDYVHTLDTLDQEIALATLPMDFNIYELPGSVYRRAKEIVKKKKVHSKNGPQHFAQHRVSWTIPAPLFLRLSEALTLSFITIQGAFRVISMPT